MNKEEVLKNCTIEGNIVKLPDTQLDRKLYQDVAKSLNLIGGKWKGGKVMGFVFQEDPTELLAQISNGEKRNLKKEYQFFGTPEGLADKLVLLAGISKDHYILEPSAGQGAIVKAINRVHPFHIVHCFELMPINQTFLSKIDTVNLISDDFLSTPISGRNTYDRIIANPPFTKNQDIDHIKQMYNRLGENGRLVSVASLSWVSGSQKKQIEFREWLLSLNAQVLDIEPGTFKESGTMVGGKIIVIDK